MARRTRKSPRSVETLTHDEASRRNIPTAEFQPVMAEEEKAPVRAAYARRNRDLDPQLVWRGKEAQDAADLFVPAPPLWIQEKVHPKALIDDLLRQSQARRDEETEAAPDLFADFNGLPGEDARTEFYRHDANWSNRMILGDSLQVMASLAEREGLRGKVQCIYIDPPYGIRFNSNFQWSTTSRDVKDGKAEHITREPEQVKAFRDTWRDGIHSYLAYLRDRLTVARELLSESGSVFVQIGDENVHRVRVLMDEVFGEGNFIAQIQYRVFGVRGGNYLDSVTDNIIWFAKDITHTKYRELFLPSNKQYEEHQSVRLFRPGYSEGLGFQFMFRNLIYNCPKNMHWATGKQGLGRLETADRLIAFKADIRYKRYTKDFPSSYLTTSWYDTWGEQNRSYVVQTATKVIQRCILMTTDPGDLVLDPTCGSGTTAWVAEQWGRRWITIDTSRVALALARARIMGARYPWYLLADSPEGQRKEAEIAGRAPSEAPTRNAIHQGFVYERVPHVTLRSIANNAEIDAIYEARQPAVEEKLSIVNGTLQAFSKGYIKEREREREIEDYIPCRCGGPQRQVYRLRCPGWRNRPHALRRSGARQRHAGMGSPARGPGRLAAGSRRSARRLLASPHRPPEGDRRLHRRESGPRISLRQALRGQVAHPRRRPVHGREPVAAPDAGGGRGRRAVLHAWRKPASLRRGARLCENRDGAPAQGRRPAGAQGGPYRLLLAGALARPLCLRRGAL